MKEVGLGLAVPLYDEEALVERVATEILDAAEVAGIPLLLALVDNGSTDRTPALIDRLALAWPARVLPVHLEQNAGYGGGILAGLAALRAAADPPVLGWAWGDGQVDPAVLAPLFLACQQGAMLARARRVARQDGPQRWLISKGYAGVLRVLGIRLPDLNGCPKLLRREALAELQPRSTDWFLDAEVVLGVLDRGWPIVDAPVIMRPRGGGRSKVRWTTLAEFGRNLAWHRIRGFAPF